MKELIKSAAGWLKIITYVATALSLIMGLLDAKTALIITISISAVVKFAEAIVGMTTSTVDDEYMAKIKEVLIKCGLLKP